MHRPWDYIDKWWNVLDGDHVGVLKLLKVVIYAFQLFLYSGIIFFKIVYLKQRINIIHLFIYVIILKGLNSGVISEG